MRLIKPARRYGVHKIFGPTIQGEGGMAGTVSHFVRLSGCNMWDGRPETREASHCPFCDTDFFSHRMLKASEIADELNELNRSEWVTVSGGEPLLQIDDEFVTTLQDNGYQVAIETNGTRPLDIVVDYLTMSPKRPEPETAIRRCDSLKLLWPHPDPRITPEAFDCIDAGAKYLQPIDSIDYESNLRSTIEKLYDLRGWRLSLQTHKLIEVE